MAYPLMFLVAGVNGAGKSSFTRSVEKKHSSMQVIDPDAIAKGITGSYQNVDDEAMSAGRIAITRVQQYITIKRSFLVESTISGRTYTKYLQLAKLNGFKTILFYVALNSPELSAKRVATRVSKGGHNIPAEDIKRRYPKSLNNLKEHIRLSDLSYVYDNSDSFKLIASYRNGILYKNNIIPSFIQPYL